MRQDTERAEPTEVSPLAAPASPHTAFTVDSEVMSNAHAAHAADRILARLTSEHRAIVLAVSGGLDSVCLAHLASRNAHASSSLRIAVFDHMSGPHSAQAVEFVVELGRALGIAVAVGRASAPARSEADWRRARWSFLKGIAADSSAIVATAHTLDDHIETVVMRVMRGGGARGLAGLLAPSRGIARPLVHTTRHELTTYAKLHSLAWVEDPTNLSRAFFRNRVRLDLLPALNKADPALAADLLRLSARAAELRAAMEELLAPWVKKEVKSQAILVSEQVLEIEDPFVRSAAWPAMLGPHQVILDRRGIERLARLDRDSRRGTRLPLSGGWEAVRIEGGVRVARTLAEVPRDRLELPQRGELQFGNWRFRVLMDAEKTAHTGEWSALLPAQTKLWVRAWRDGDRIAAGPQGSKRRVKRFFADQKVAAIDRKGWPVVLSNDEIIWIPGIRRVEAASVRSGRPVRLVVCERIKY